jgi:hypothetical protein
MDSIEAMTALRHADGSLEPFHSSCAEDLSDETEWEARKALLRTR